MAAPADVAGVGEGAAAPVALADVRARARRRLDPAVWDFVEGGAGAEATVRANVRAFRRVCLVPAALTGAPAPDLGVELLGARLAVPFAVAPLAFHGLLHPAGELATVRAAGRAGALTVVAMMASRPLAEVAAAATGPLWFQAYWLRDRGLLRALVAEAEAAGCRALVLTVDLPRMARRRRDLRNGFALPAGVLAANLAPAGGGAGALHRGAPASSALRRHAELAFDSSVTWDDVARLGAATRLPIVVKGVLTGADARRAADAGAAAVVVSNHGGRQLDGAVPALAGLVEVAEAVGDRCAVLMDGGIRSGTDVLKALAFGARAVLVGRPVLWGLAAGGEEGVHDVLGILRAELDEAMALSGRATLGDVDATLVRPADELRFPGRA